MHFYCRCGYRISDTTDFISYKARIIADQDWDDFLDRIVEAIESCETDREKVVDDFYSNTLGVEKAMYQCPDCGRIFIDGEGNSLYSFGAEEPVKKDLLLSAKGESWQGFLHAEWDDVKPEWREHHGNIWPNINLKYNIPGFDDYNEFEEKYYQVFEELKNKNVIRNALMKRNRKVLHHWENEETEKRWKL